MAEVAVAAVHACARLGNGTVWCWGNGGSGRLGTGGTTSSFVPVPVTGIATAKRLVAGGSTTCAVLDDDTVRCWGLNQQGDTAGVVWCWGLGMNGELGGGAIVATQPVPAPSFDACP